MLLSENAASPSESLDSLVLESDSSSRPSSLKRPGMTKFKLFRSYSLDVNPTSLTNEGIYNFCSCNTKAIIGSLISESRNSIPTWTCHPFSQGSACLTAILEAYKATSIPISLSEVFSPSRTRCKPFQIPLASFPSLTWPRCKPPGPKPIPRTMPYGPPYFATPPMLLDRNATTRPQFKDEILNSQAPESDIEHSQDPQFLLSLLLTCKTTLSRAL
jgi:hypothetical protein